MPFVKGAETSPLCLRLSSCFLLFPHGALIIFKLPGDNEFLPLGRNLLKSGVCTVSEQPLEFHMLPSISAFVVSAARLPSYSLPSKGGLSLLTGEPPEHQMAAPRCTCTSSASMSCIPVAIVARNC